MLLYQLYDFQRTALAPLRLTAEAIQQTFSHPFWPVSYTQFGRALAAGAELIERSTRHYAKPAFGLDRITVGGEDVADGPVEGIGKFSEPTFEIAHIADTPSVGPLGFQQIVEHLTRRPARQ